MDVRPHALFQKLLQWLLVLTKRVSSVVLRLLYALQAYLRRQSSTPSSRKAGVGSSRCLLADGAESQVVNPSKDLPLLPINTSHTQIAAAPYVSQFGDTVYAGPTSSTGDSNQVDVKVKTMSTDGVKRYERNIRLSRKDEIKAIPANTTTFKEGMQDHVAANGWTRSVHPEGAVYFRHERRGIYTDADIRDVPTFEIINRAIARIHETLLEANMSIEQSENVQLVIELHMPKGKSKRTSKGRPKHHTKSKDRGDAEGNAKPTCLYYFVNHARRCLLWPTEFTEVSNELFFHVRGVKSWDHVRHAMERQYWFHCELFPDSLYILPAKDLPASDSQSAELLVHELKQIIMHASGDALTSKTSLVPFDKEELGKMLELMDHIRDSFGTSDTPISPCVKVLMARLMRTFAHARFFNFYGEIGARLDADQTVYNVTERRASVLLLFISWLLFRAPDVHLKTLRTIWVDQTINYVPWTKFLDKLNSEWQELVLYATVILNANVAFLAIPASPSDAQIASQICSYISVAASVGAVATGLLLMRQNRTKHRETANDAAAFMMRMDHSVFGMETVAMLFSMPYGMLMWSVIFFVSAFCIAMFDGKNLVTHVLVGLIGFLVLLFTIWTVLYAYTEDEAEPLRRARNFRSKKKHNHHGAHPSGHESEENGGSAAALPLTIPMPQLSVPVGRPAGPTQNSGPSPHQPPITMPQPQIAMPEPT
ncbi:hypothetical protein BDN67DRAFT_1066314 [Paxillus ammoniavirescens]|nr:hypothetical protein BDN67DRAFT_1066314 [Paxillus ammoniavirescens]